MSTMSRCDTTVDEIVEVVLEDTAEWIADGEAIPDIVAFVAIEVVDTIFTGRVKVDAEDVPYVIGHATSRALVEAKLRGLGPTEGDPRYALFNVG